MLAGAGSADMVTNPDPTKMFKSRNVKEKQALITCHLFELGVIKAEGKKNLSELVEAKLW